MSIKCTKLIMGSGRWKVIAEEKGLFVGFAIVETEAMADIIISDPEDPEIIWQGKEYNQDH